MIGYFDVRNGCAGDMIAGALAGCVEGNEIKKILNGIDFPYGYSIEIRQVLRSSGHSHGIKANQFIVNVNEKENERSYKEIVSIFNKSRLPLSIKERILAVFETLAHAESKVHEEPIEKLHFHSVGQTDALVEVAFSIIALDFLGIKRIFASPVGISCAAPATLKIASGIPVIMRNFDFESTTPTGISIIKTLVESYQDTPPFLFENYSYGTGTLLTDLPDVVQFSYGKNIGSNFERIGVLETSVDDMNPLVFDHLMEVLYKVGALEVSFFTGITKKSRPIFSIRIMCRPEQKQRISEIIFKETTTLGIRYREEERIILERRIRKIKTKYGDINVKIAYLSSKEPVNIMPEYEDCKAVAIREGIPLKKVVEEVLRIILNEK